MVAAWIAQSGQALENADAAGLGPMPAWDLTDLYPTPGSAEFATDLAASEGDAEAFAARYSGKLASILADYGGDGLAAPIREFESMQDRLGRIGSFAYLHYVTDTADPARAKFFGDVQQNLTDISIKLLFFTLELNRLDDGAIDAALATPALGYYRPWLTDLRQEKPYELSDDLEKLFQEKSITSQAAWGRLFSETMTSLRFEIDGEMLPLEPALNRLTDPDDGKRRAAGEALSKVFRKNVRLFTLITNTLAKDKEISDRWRGYSDVASARHLSNRVEPEVVDALVSAVKARYEQLSHRYYALKARWLQVDTLNFWDRNAPISTESSVTVPWDEARRTVLEAFRGFSPDIASIASTFFEKRWIDGPVRDGKAPGAFAHPTVPSAHPYVMMNYQGKPRDVMTLAHELGHGVHQVLANGQGPLMAYTPLTLAETASVFGEMLTFKALLAKTADASERKALLAQKVEDKINTVVRQVAFYEFERRLHVERRNGELTSEQIGRIWIDVQRESLGPSVTLNEGYENYWVYIPHFVHSPFYVYAYAFGDCLVNSLYAVYEKTPDGFQQRYLDLLKAGGSKHHKELLAPFGLDATDPDFWTLGLNVIENLITELEGMEDA
ncbi:MAG: M3 family oligoendopeptidase [Hyphomicrobiales bacterium]|nr:M3 family oligoendopeptidase [Hyphomicrobiales bacterium]